jgi:hypothetical protein
MLVLKVSWCGITLREADEPRELLQQPALVGRPRGLRGCTRARCYSSLAFLVHTGILHTNETGEGQ